MATLLRFNDVDPAAPEPASMVMIRKMLASEDVRFLLGDFLLRLACHAPAPDKRPHENLFNRLVGDDDAPGADQIRILMRNFDNLRAYDQKKTARRSFLAQ